MTEGVWLVVAAAVTALSGIVAARLTWRAQRRALVLQEQIAKSDEASRLMEQAIALSRAAQDDLQHARTDRDRMEQAWEDARRQWTADLDQARSEIAALRRDLERCQQAEEQWTQAVEAVRAESEALRAELHEYRGLNRSSGSRTRWNDVGEDTADER